VVEVRTARLTLREFVDDDFAAFHAVESDPEVARYQTFPPRTVADCRAYLAGARDDAASSPRRTYDLAIVLAEEDRLIGRCGLGRTDEEPDEALLWYTLLRTEWGRGYATEAARGMLDFGFRDLRLHRIWADCDPANAASFRVLEKIGLRREGHLLENAWIKGAWVDSLVYAILDREWIASPPSPSRLTPDA